MRKRTMNGYNRPIRPIRFRKKFARGLACLCQRTLPFSLVVDSRLYLLREFSPTQRELLTMCVLLELDDADMLTCWHLTANELKTSWTSNSKRFKKHRPIYLFVITWRRCSVKWVSMIHTRIQLWIPSMQDPKMSSVFYEKPIVTCLLRTFSGAFGPSLTHQFLLSHLATG